MMQHVQEREKVKTSKKLSRSRRGFIGPLGDDIPSIFPIVAGMLLFIGTILYVNAQVDQRSADFRVREATQKIAYLATAKGTFLSGEFKATCDTSIRPFAENNRLKFAVVIKRFCAKGCPTCGNGIDLVNSNPFNEDENANTQTWSDDYICTSSNPEIIRQFADARQDKQRAPSDATTLLYPIAVPCPDTTSPTNGLGTINILVWK